MQRRFTLKMLYYANFYCYLRFNPAERGVPLNFIIFFFFPKKNSYYCRTRRLSVRLSSVEITSFRGNLTSHKPIDLKIGLNVGYGSCMSKRRNFSKF